jgi:hypothetical protein
VARRKRPIAEELYRFLLLSHETYARYQGTMLGEGNLTSHSVGGSLRVGTDCP